MALDGATIATFDQETPNFKARGAPGSLQRMAIE
jgi:hypothetical protein